MNSTGLSFTASLVVAACGASRGIGKNGKLPWGKLPSDLAHFKKLTMGKAVVMGRKTYESLPPKFQPLPQRLNVVISKQGRSTLNLPDSVLLASSLSAAEQLLRAANISSAVVVGGAAVYKEALSNPTWSNRVHYTHIQEEFDSDTYFPVDLDQSADFKLETKSEKIEESNATYEFREYRRRGHRKSSPSKTNHEELQYIDLARRILNKGVSKPDRTGVGTRNIFGVQMRFSLRNGKFPLLTTKKVFFRGVVEELLWFIRGSTNGNELAAKNIHIWDGNGSREFLDKRGLKDREVGDLGPVYGFQWRHFGAQYRTMHHDYSGQGYDQLEDVIRKIKYNPEDRRIIMSAWNPCALKDMALPPCHMFCQFFVADGELSCQMYQRSCDIGLGVPFNIASYALLTCIFAHHCDLKPGEFVHTLGDAHIYNNHVEAIQQQLERSPFPFPTLTIKKRSDRKAIEDYIYEDFKLENYQHHGAVKMKMAV